MNNEFVSKAIEAPVIDLSNLYPELYTTEYNEIMTLAEDLKDCPENTIEVSDFCIHNHNYVDKQTQEPKVLQILYLKTNLGWFQTTTKSFISKWCRMRGMTISANKYIITLIVKESNNGYKYLSYILKEAV